MPAVYPTIAGFSALGTALLPPGGLAVVHRALGGEGVPLAQERATLQPTSRPRDREALSVALRRPPEVAGYTNALECPMRRRRYPPWPRRGIREWPLAGDLLREGRFLLRRRQRLNQEGVDGEHQVQSGDLDEALRVTRPADHKERSALRLKPSGA